MQTELNHTVKALFGKESLELVSREDLNLMTQRYPYAAIFHYLYSRKLQLLNDLRYPSSVAKTALYFSNPHWLHHQLRSRTSVEVLAEMEMAYENSHPHVAESFDDTFSNVPEETKLVHIQDEDEDIIQPVTDTPVPIEETIPQVIEEEINSAVTELEEEITVDDSNVAEKDLVSEVEEVPLTEPDLPIVTKEPDLVSHKPFGESADMGLIPLEPLYAVDYFASQGIRLREEDQQDPLGRKLKSFTEWLKSMKKIHPERSKGQLDEKTEEVIKTEAELSNDRAEVLTETMAEVLLKQGLKEKAIEVYEKLSLLDPAKSATFAAKISELKAVGI